MKGKNSNDSEKQAATYSSILKKTKNLNIRSSETSIDNFKIIAFEFYKQNKQLKLFSFRHYLVLVLLSIENHFKAIYGMIEKPSEDYIQFYKKRGTKANIDRIDVILDTVNFLLPLDYSDLYFSLMHTYYIHEKQDLSCYSISLFFEYIVIYINEYKIELKEVNLF